MTSSAIWWAVYLVAVAAYWGVVVVGLDGAWGALAYFGLLLPATVALVRKVGLNGVALRTPKPKEILWGVSGFFVVGMAWPLIESLGSVVAMPMFWSSFADGSEGPVLGVAAAAAAVLVAPACEEVWFRGLAHAQLVGRGMGNVATVGVVSVAFGLLHLYGGPGFAVFITLWSIVAGFVRVRTDGIAACIVMHALTNVFAHVVVPIAFD